MSTGRRYESEPKLNLKKVFGVISIYCNDFDNSYNS